MKSQGLPINFIVLAAVAILILILVVGFVVAGGGAFQRAVTPATARSQCETFCSRIQADAMTKDYHENLVSNFEAVGALRGHKEYCTTQDVEGVGSLNCLDLGVTCYVTFSEGITRRMQCGEPGEYVEPR